MLQSYLSPQAYLSAKTEKLKREAAQRAAVQIAGMAPLDYVRRYLGVLRLADYQLDILRMLGEQHFVAVRGPHGIGKTVIAAAAVLWALACWEDFKIVTTAGSWTQLSHYLWPEIHKWAGRVTAWPGYVPELLALGAKRKGGQALAVASKNPSMAEGGHAPKVLFIFDEAKVIPAEMFDAAEGAFSTGEGYGLAISTPGETKGRFYDIHKRRAGLEKWATRHVTIEEAIAAGRITQAWADECRRLWGADSAIYRNRVLAEFADQATNAVIPLSWIEAANHRWLEWQAAGFPGKLTDLGVDVGGGGEGGDLSTYAPIYDRIKVKEVIEYPVGDPNTATMEVVGHIGALLRSRRGAIAFVDVIGVGAGVVHRSHEPDVALPVYGFNAARATKLRDQSGDLGFFNWRAAAWWMMREIMNPETGYNVCLPPDNRLTGDLGLPTYRLVSKGMILIESKAEIRKRNEGHSTDYADAVVMGIAGRVLMAEAEGGKVRVGYDPVQIGNY